MKSIIQEGKYCYVCGALRDLEEHHIYAGRARRPLSEKYGLKVYLCRTHHRGKTGAHNSLSLNTSLHRIGERAFLENGGTVEEFIELFGKNYL